MASGVAPNDQNEALLVTYGDLRNAIGRALLPGKEVLALLLSRGYWLARRTPRKSFLGEIVLFYEARIGFTAAANLTGVSVASQTDWVLPTPSMFQQFPIKLLLRDARVFPKPVELAPIADKLNFITNKTKWGSALRPTPKSIPIADARFILKQATPSLI